MPAPVLPPENIFYKTVAYSLPFFPIDHCIFSSDHLLSKKQNHLSMKQPLILLCAATLFLLSCNNDKTETPAETPSVSAAPADLPYVPTYSTNWSTDVPDSSLKLVLMSYKDWADGNIAGLAGAMADSVEVEMSSGEHFKASNADLMKRWGSYRDSLSNVKIVMETWNKMYATDKKEGYIVTWYKEYDTFKSGKIDSASYHDVNQVKDGKISWYSQYKTAIEIKYISD